MIIIYNSKTGFTKKYAEMLANRTGLSLYSVDKLTNVPQGSNVIFLGWIRAGKIQGLKKVTGRCEVKAVCACGSGQKAEPEEETFIKNNHIGGLPFFYLRGGCLPIRQLKGMDKIAMYFFLCILKSKKPQSASVAESIRNIEQGCDYVSEDRITPVIDWVNRSLA